MLIKIGIPILLCHPGSCPSFCLSTILTTTSGVTAASVLPVLCPLHCLLCSKSLCQGLVATRSGSSQTLSFLLLLLPPTPWQVVRQRTP